MSGAGTYTLTATDTVTGCEGTASVEVESDLSSPDITITGNDDITCNNLTRTLIANIDNAT